MPYQSSVLNQEYSSQASSTLLVCDHIDQPSVVASTLRPAGPLGRVTTSHWNAGLSWIRGTSDQEPSSHMATCPWANCSRVLRMLSGYPGSCCGWMDALSFQMRACSHSKASIVLGWSRVDLRSFLGSTIVPPFCCTLPWRRSGDIVCPTVPRCPSRLIPNFRL